ncbi:exonuclease subunit SbcD [Azotobacter beijerinckii]|uniref:exonuclease subunit SbcD n=1 Tax=Azotobacter beijerinckii TaxID=170623 RepID=UPI002952AAC1|nr:exonuclease subunit SbcD [Azotobacter beijerinckii]MDV7213664.1 exonuclease subunit SbcD [Azotobacter beijerinckii]
MRLLHTSDWHLGQHFMGKTRQAEHQAFCAWLIEQVREHAVDALIVAGDVFDSGAPPSYAREQYNRFIVALRETGARLVVLGGNHDSVAMLGESRDLLACLDTWVIPGVAADPAEQLLVLPQRDGTPGALLCAIPFVRPRDVLKSEAGQSAEDKQQALQAAIREHYRALFELAEARRAELGGALPIVASGHLTTVGASASESVREIYVGSLEALPTDAFPPAAYIALGHIHRPQKVGGREHIRYSGSPIPLSFDEARQQKEVLLVDLHADGLEAVTPLPVPCFQPLVTLRGALAELAGDGLLAAQEIAPLREAGELSGLCVDGREIRAQRIVFCAGAGNAELLAALGLSQPAMQRRPLHMVMLKAPTLAPLYAHCLGGGPKPRLTVTSHPAADGQWVWYLGGDLAEAEGVARNEAQQIAMARRELNELLPWIDLTPARWATLRVDRAEPAQSALARPDNAFLAEQGRLLVGWPTKLALAPDLSDRVFASLERDAVRPAAHPPLPALPRPPRAQPVWEELLP